MLTAGWYPKGSKVVELTRNCVIIIDHEPWSLSYHSLLVLFDSDSKHNLSTVSSNRTSHRAGAPNHSKSKPHQTEAPNRSYQTNLTNLISPNRNTKPECQARKNRSHQAGPHQSDSTKAFPSNRPHQAGPLQTDLHDSSDRTLGTEMGPNLAAMRRAKASEGDCSDELLGLFWLPSCVSSRVHPRRLEAWNGMRWDD